MGGVLVVCTGNLCRSPLAAGYLSMRLADSGSGRIVASAGTHGVEGSPATPQACEVALENGFDISGHRGCEITIAMLEQYALVLLMERSQREHLAQLYPEWSNKLRLLSEFGPHDGPVDIPDPYGAPVEQYRHVFSLMRPCLDNFAAWWADQHLVGGVLIIKATTGSDQRGWSSHLAQIMPWPLREMRNVHAVELLPAAVRGNHLHQSTNEAILVIGGPCEAVFCKDGDVAKVVCAQHGPVLIAIPAGTAHAFRNFSDSPIELICLTDREFDPQEPDQIRVELIA
ncbi:MAG: WxcM-like domain-containing protein [Candidatus Alcyoniella australis]|nr:WxcM-like domain-containing protein [Candidatus Alcyoniella australis]